MTNEQREAIKRLSHLLAKGKYGVAGKTLLYEDYYMLKNVLEVVENQEQKIIKQRKGVNLTKEQEEAIEICKEKIIEPFYDFPNPTSVELKDTDVKAIETVLNLIKEQQKEIESLQKEVNEENNRCMILANNDKFKEQVINLMALSILNYDDQLIINRYKNIDDVKKTFKDLAKEGE